MRARTLRGVSRGGTVASDVLMPGHRDGARREEVLIKTSSTSPPIRPVNSTYSTRLNVGKPARRWPKQSHDGTGAQLDSVLLQRR